MKSGRPCWLGKKTGQNAGETNVKSKYAKGEGSVPNGVRDETKRERSEPTRKIKNAKKEVKNKNRGFVQQNRTGGARQQAIHQAVLGKTITKTLYRTKIRKGGLLCGRKQKKGSKSLHRDLGGPGPAKSTSEVVDVTIKKKKVANDPASNEGGGEGSGGSPPPKGRGKGPTFPLKRTGGGKNGLKQFPAASRTVGRWWNKGEDQNTPFNKQKGKRGEHGAATRLFLVPQNPDRKRKKS